MRILVTGASGFLGRFLVSKLNSLDFDVTPLSSKDADLTDCSSLEKFIHKKYDQIIHLAAWTQAGDFCLRHPGEQWIINQKINTNILSFWLNYQPQALFVSMGTSCSYSPNLNLIESNYLKGEPIDSLYTYAMTKRMLQIGLESISSQYGLKYLTVVPSTLYGPNYHNDGRQMHFIFDLIRKILHSKNSGNKTILWGDGNQKRELVYIEDFISDLMFLIGSADNEIINIGAGSDYSIKDFARIICDIVDYDFNQIEFDTTKYVGAKSKLLDTTKLSDFTPEGFKRTALQEGLNNTISWMRDNYDF